MRGRSTMTGGALVVPQMTTSDDADIVDVWTLDGETLEGQRRELSTGTASRQRVWHVR